MHRRPDRLLTLVCVIVFTVACMGLAACGLLPPETGVLVDEAQNGTRSWAPERSSDIRPVRTQYTEGREHCADHNPQRSAWFGDLHVHTSRSLDAGIQDTRTTPYQAYLFARGERIGLQPWSDTGATGLSHMLPVSPATTLPNEEAKPGRTLQLGRPLDFAMVSDHAEFFGEVQICGEEGLFQRTGLFRRQSGFDSRGYLASKCVDLRKAPLAQFVRWNFDYLGRLPAFRGSDEKGMPRYKSVCGNTDGDYCLEAARTTWDETIAAAEAAYDKTRDCDFTAFVGYEYTSTPLSDNMHRNVVFRNANVPDLPISYMEARSPEVLWARLDDACKPELGCEVFTIPHNSNLSGGRMFRRNVLRTEQGDFDAFYSRVRQGYEPLIEIYQHKGDSECPIGSADEFCTFEKMPYSNLIADRFGGAFTKWPGPDFFVRWALGRGIEIENRVGVNPFRYGVIASTDTHLGAPGAVNEARFQGHGGAGGSANDAVPADDDDLLLDTTLDMTMPEGLVDNIAFSGGGLAVVWAEENSRDFLFDSMRRRETYGTSGPRIPVRFFGGWHYPDEMCSQVQYDPTGAALESGDFVRMGYEQGVPMGGNLPPPLDADERPSFAVAALRDPGFAAGDSSDERFERSVPLQQIHIIKGWVDESGKMQERVVSVAGNASSDAGVDLDTCEPHGTGADALCTVWRDDDFDPDERAFYYARVVENPSCRWSWLQCTEYAHGHDVDLEEACRSPKALPEGARPCCDHASLASLRLPDASARPKGPDQLRRKKEGAQKAVTSYPETVQERAWTSPIWYRP